MHSFWTLEQARGVIAQIKPGTHVVMVGAGFISFTILNSILSLGAKLTIVEIAPRILPRMIDDTGARARGAVAREARRHRPDGRHGHGDRGRRGAGSACASSRAATSSPTSSIMATGIRTNLEWLKDSGVTINRGIVVDDHLRSNVPNVYAAGDVAEGKDLITGEAAVHAIEPTAQEHGRVVGANMAGKRRALPRQPAHEHRRGLPPRRRVVRRVGRRARPRRSAGCGRTGPRTASCCSAATG